MSDHPHFVAIKKRHAAEIDDLTTNFGSQYAALMNATGPARDVKAIHALRSSHRAAIKETVFRHVKVENAWQPPEEKPADTPEEAARFVGHATTLDKAKED